MIPAILGFMHKPAAGGGGAASYIGGNTNGAAFGTSTSVTISELDAVAGKVVVAVFTGSSIDACEITAVTIGGASGSQRGTVQQDALGRTNVEFWEATVTASNGGVIAVTTAQNVTRIAASAYNVDGLTYQGSDGLADSDATTAHTITTTCSAGDSVIAAIYNAGGFATSWTGATENFDANAEATIYMSSALNDDAAANQAVTATLGGGFAGTVMAVAWYA